MKPRTTTSLFNPAQPHLIILEGDGLARLGPFEGSVCAVVHLVEPVVRAGEPALVVDHPNRQVAGVDAQVEGDAPHHN